MGRGIQRPASFQGFDLDRAPERRSLALPVLFGVVSVFALGSLLFNVAAFAVVTDREALRATIADLESQLEHAGSEREAAAAAIAASEAALAEATAQGEALRAKVRELEDQVAVAGAEAMSLKRQMADLDEDPSQLPQPSEAEVLARIKSFSVRAALGDEARLGGVREGVVAEHAKSVGRQHQLAFEDDAGAILVVAVDASRSAGAVIVSAKVIERWRVPGKAWVWPVAVAERTWIAVWESDRDVLDAVERAVGQLAEAIIQARRGGGG